MFRNFAKFTGKQQCLSLLSNKVAGLRLATLLKKRLRHMFFPMNFMKFLRIPFLQNTPGRLLLSVLLEGIITNFSMFILFSLNFYNTVGRENSNKKVSFAVS